MSKEGLIISLLKSKIGSAEFFNNNLDNDKISEIKEILDKLRDILTKEYRKKIKEKTLRNRKYEKSFKIRKRRD